jgi:hypothetical protein
VDRWLKLWREGGFDALLPPTRQVTPRTPEEVLDLAAALKRENPSRSTAQVVRILQQHLGWGPSYRTVHRHLQRLELLTRPARAGASPAGCCAHRGPAPRTRPDRARSRWPWTSAPRGSTGSWRGCPTARPQTGSAPGWPPRLPSLRAAGPGRHDGVPVRFRLVVADPEGEGWRCSEHWQEHLPRSTRSAR